MADALCFIGHCEDKNRLNVANMSSFEWLERPPMVEDIDVTNEDQDEVPQVRHNFGWKIARKFVIHSISYIQKGQWPCFFEIK